MPTKLSLKHAKYVAAKYKLGYLKEEHKGKSQINNFITYVSAFYDFMSVESYLQKKKRDKDFKSLKALKRKAGAVFQKELMKRGEYPNYYYYKMKEVANLYDERICAPIEAFLLKESTASLDEVDHTLYLECFHVPLKIYNRSKEEGISAFDLVADDEREEIYTDEIKYDGELECNSVLMLDEKRQESLKNGCILIACLWISTPSQYEDCPKIMWLEDSKDCRTVYDFYNEVLKDDKLREILFKSGNVDLENEGYRTGFVGELTREKISESRKGYRSKEVVVVDDEGEIVGKFSSMASASRAVDLQYNKKSMIPLGALIKGKKFTRGEWVGWSAQCTGLVKSEKKYNNYKNYYY